MSSALRSMRPLSWDGTAIVYLNVRAIPDVVYERAGNVAETVAAIVGERVAGTTLDLFGAFGIAFARREGIEGISFQTVVDQMRKLCEPNALDSAIERVAGADAEAALAEAQACLTDRDLSDAAIANNALLLVDGVSAILIDGASGSIANRTTATARQGNSAARRAEGNFKVFVREGQLRHDAAPLTVFGLQQAGFAAMMVPDRATSWLLQSAKIDAVICSAKAIDATANAVCRMGTYGIALAAAHHGIPCYLAVSRSIVDCTLDETQLRTIAAGSDRYGGTTTGGTMVSRAKLTDTRVFPPYDITPGRFFSAIVTEYGITRPPYDESLTDLLSRPRFSLLSKYRMRDESIEASQL